MLMLLNLIIELLAIFILVHAVHGRKLKLDVPTTLTYVSMIAIMFLNNILEGHGAVVIITYVILYLFCVFRFKEGPIAAFVGVVLAIVLMVVIQFCFVIVFSALPAFDEAFRGFIINMIALCITVLLAVRGKLNRLKDIICRRHWLMYSILAFALIVVMLSLVQMKKDSSINIGLFAFGIPSIVLLFCLLVYWDKSRRAEKELKTEMTALLHMKNCYEDLVVKVKENQHGLNNHMMAVFSTHYTYKNYEELVEAQQKYCGTIQDANKYNSLVLINHAVLGGFLYAKFLEMEEKGITIEYRICSAVGDCELPCFNLIEALGVLLDNAAEAVTATGKTKTVCFEVVKRDEHYVFTVRNVFREVGFDEMEKWFYLGETTKGQDHGLGLHRVRELCEQYKGEITCRNARIEGENWIEFNLVVKEKEGDA